MADGAPPPAPVTPAVSPPATGSPPPGGPATTTTTTPSGTDWRASLPEDLRGEGALKDFTDVPSLAKAFVDTKRMVGGSIRLPPKGARPEAWDEVYSKLGRPEKPDQYEVTPPPMPEGVPWDTGAQQQFLEHSHKLGLTPSQVQGVLDYYGDHVARSVEQAQQQTRQSAEETLKSLEQEYGPITFQRHLATVQAFVQAEGDPELMAELERTGWGNHPALTRLLMRVSEDWKSDQIARGMREEDFTGMPSPTAAGEEAKKIMADMKGPYWQRNHPLHQETRQQVARLMSIAHPNQRRPE
jgi:hypothetical protein